MRALCPSESDHARRKRDVISDCLSAGGGLRILTPLLRLE
jgi:hypothetical protein